MTSTLWGSSRVGRGLRATVVLAVGGAVLLACGAVGTSRSEAADLPKPFTFMVLPDTQGYTKSAENASIMSQQTRWIRDYRANLNTAFVAQVGDLVESHPSDPMWQRASTSMKVLDDAGIPNAVLPGNHDMNVATGDAAKFDEYFPSSRYAGSTWTPSTAKYGGYLGQDLYGPDPVDRGNKDSFSLFSAGGMDFLVLSLEYEAPDYAIAWAQKVIANHPDRRVIVSMHDFIDTDNQRGDFNTRKDAGINAAPQIWDQLIFPNCNVFMVVNGHWTSRTDATQGEGRRSDVNACGKPVHQLLSNYQGRPHGGDGWLRYYTFDPAKNHDLGSHVFAVPAEVRDRCRQPVHAPVRDGHAPATICSRCNRARAPNGGTASPRQHRRRPGPAPDSTRAPGRRVAPRWASAPTHPRPTSTPRKESHDPWPRSSGTT